MTAPRQKRRPIKLLKTKALFCAKDSFTLSTAVKRISIPLLAFAARPAAQVPTAQKIARGIRRRGQDRVHASQKLSARHARRIAPHGGQNQHGVSRLQIRHLNGRRPIDHAANISASASAAETASTVTARGW